MVPFAVPAVIVAGTDALPAVFYVSLRSATSSSDVMKPSLRPVGVLVLELSAHMCLATRSWPSSTRGSTSEDEARKRWQVPEKPPVA